jgi:hypothetical protein
MVKASRNGFTWGVLLCQMTLSSYTIGRMVDRQIWLLDLDDSGGTETYLDGRLTSKPSNSPAKSASKRSFGAHNEQTLQLPTHPNTALSALLPNEN